MRKLLWTLLSGLFAITLAAQEPYPELGAKLDEYFAVLSGEDASLQASECDFLIESCQDSLVRQYVTIKIYEHYVASKIMGDDAVAVHVADQWILSGKVPLQSEEDLLNTRIYAEFNRASLIGQQAPSVTMQTPEGEQLRIPAKGNYSVLYFYDTGCSSCKVETPRLARLMQSGEFPLTVYAIYTGADAAAWEAYRPQLDGAVHLWDPAIQSDWQRLYGVLKTPKMLLVNPSGTIVGRGLDTPALQILLNRELSTGHFSYGEPAQMERYSQLFAAYGDTLSTAHVLEVADYLAARTFGEGNIDAFKQVAGDLLYYISSQKTEVFRDAAGPFVQRYIQLPDVWTSDEDKAQVVSLGQLLLDLTSRTPVGSQVPDLQAYGTLRRKPCLFRKGAKEGLYSLRSLKGKPGYLVFYTGGCSSCTETLEAVDRIVRQNRRARVLLIDVDALLTDHPQQASALLDSFDLSGLPMVLELDAKGIVRRRYVDLMSF